MDYECRYFWEENPKQLMHEHINWFMTEMLGLEKVEGGYKTPSNGKETR